MSQKIAQNKVEHAIKRTLITLVFLISIIFLIKVAPNYIKTYPETATKLIINNKDVTNSLKTKIMIENDVVYLSTEDVKNFFDEYLIQDENEIITTSSTKTVNIAKSSNKMYVNGSYIDLENKVFAQENYSYLPMNDLSKIYNIEISYNSSTNSVIIDPLSKKKVQAIASKDLPIKYKATSLSKNIAQIKRGDTLVVIQDQEKNENVEIGKWIKVRSQNGSIGYVKKNQLINQETVRENLEEDKINGKVGLVWDYYNQYNTAPTRTEKIDGINVVSPSFYELKSDGSLVTNIGQSGKKYIEWAHSNNYEVWPTLSNSMINNLDTVSNIMKTFKSRANLIDNITNSLIDADVDGINIDFENMYKEDKDKYSRFIIELAPRLQEVGKRLCVDLTAPDGSDTWSLCYDRHTIGKVADYVVFIGYDQNTASSTTAGTVAGADWVELNITKFLGQEEINNSKIILAMPFYTRLWKEQNGKVTSKVVNMNKIEIPNGATKEWNENTKQNYIEYTKDNVTYKMWLEDEDSITEKLNLVNKYNLAGAGFWEKDRENDDIWNIVKEKLNIETEK